MITATAQAFNEATNTSPEATPEQQAQKMGQYYIRDAVPLKGMNREDGTIGADGKTFYLLQCFPVAEHCNPGQVRDMKFDGAQARYFTYYGHMSRFKGDHGLIVGYVENCFGKTMDTPEKNDIQQRVVTETMGALMPRPDVSRDIDQPYGRMQERVAGIDEHIRIMRDVNEARQAPRVPRKNGLKCIGG